jgi:MFS family permease
MVSRTRGDVWFLAAASAASNTGNWAASVALSLVVFAKTGSTVWLSASFLFTQVPSALVAPLSGMMADRLDRKRIMITCDLPTSSGWLSVLHSARRAWSRDLLLSTATALGVSADVAVFVEA